MHDTPLPPSFTNNLYSHPAFFFALTHTFQLPIMTSVTHPKIWKDCFYAR